MRRYHRANYFQCTEHAQKYKTTWLFNQHATWKLLCANAGTWKVKYTVNAGNFECIGIKETPLKKFSNI